ncbi:MAG TPA: peptidoglycan-binding domain-containing protein [Puia sp.]|nr:peptidoglycan-binding domain-containing protein [Puia sp.]
MSYRSRLDYHRNAQAPEKAKKKPFFSSKHDTRGADEKGKFFVQRLATSEIDERLGTNDERMARNKGDKLRQGDAGSSRGGVPDVQRELAIKPLNPDAAEPELTPQQIHKAIIYNNNRYGPKSIQLIQGIVDATGTGIMDEETVRKIAHYQAKFNLKVDGMAGPNTFGQLTDELGAAGASQDSCLNSFLVNVTPLQLTRLERGFVKIQGNTSVEIRFDPHCDCSRFQYRQFVGGDVTENGVNINDSFDHLPPDHRLPGLGNFIQDGDTDLPANGPYGHRGLQPNLGDVLDEYTDADGTTLNMASGCRYRSTDFVGFKHRQSVAGDHYIFDMRFFGVILMDGKVIEKKFWAFRGDITV